MQKCCPICKRFMKKEDNFVHNDCSERKQKEIEIRLEEMGYPHKLTGIMSTDIVFDFVHQGVSKSHPVISWLFEEFFNLLNLSTIEKKALDFSNDNEIRNQKPKQVVMDMRGGAREGAGRKRKGIRKPVSINLPDEEWRKIHEKIASGEVKGLSDYFVNLHLEGSTHVHS